MKFKTEMKKGKFRPVAPQLFHAKPVPRTSVKATGKRAPKPARSGKR